MPAAIINGLFPNDAGEPEGPGVCLLIDVIGGGGGSLGSSAATLDAEFLCFLRRTSMMISGIPRTSIPAAAAIAMISGVDIGLEVLVVGCVDEARDAGESDASVEGFEEEEYDVEVF